MIRGFYSAAAGMLTRQRSINAISNNIANTTTPGFKTQTTIESSLIDRPVFRIDDTKHDVRLGKAALITVNDDNFTDFTQGRIERTDRNVDLAILGKGFFLVEDSKHGQVLTRNGQMALDEKGILYVPGVGKVLNSSGAEITLKSANYTVGQDGRIYDEEGKETARLGIVYYEDDTILEKVGDGVFKGPDNHTTLAETEYKIMQGSIETSNVNVAKEMSKLIAGQGHFQSCSQILRIYDRINEIAVNKIGSLE